MDATPNSAASACEITDERLARVATRATETFAERGLVAEWALGQLTFVVPRGEIREVAAFLRDDPELRFVRLSDLTGFDGQALGHEPRFAVVYHFYSLVLSRWVGVRVPVDESNPIVPSLTPEWAAADWHERETFDLFGIRFGDHPNLVRILTPDDWQGHPLRKDYPFEPEPVEYSFNVDKINAGRVVQRQRERGQAQERGTTDRHR
jgi:NADH-quinone oxidoreductase subunit C